MSKASWLGMALIVVGLSGCGSKPQDLILGKWQSTQTRGRFDTIEFMENGNYTYSSPHFKNLYAKGTYKWLGDEQIETDHTVPVINVNKVEKWKVAIEGDDLTLTDENGNPIEFKRVKQ